MDSVTSSGVPSPGYTSQRDILSFVDDNNEETVSNHLFSSPSSVLMASRYRELYHLLSPYSLPHSSTDNRIVCMSRIRTQDSLFIAPQHRFVHTATFILIANVIISYRIGGSFRRWFR
jgi:hypothetical protein